MEFGKYEGMTLAAAFAKDKDYFKWAIDNEVNQPEIHFIRENMTKREVKQMGLL